MRWKPLFAVLLGLLMVGVTAETGSASTIPSPAEDDNPLGYVRLDQGFKLLLDDGTMLNLAQKPASTNIVRGSSFTKIIKKYHLRKLFVSEITFVERNKLKTILVISSNETTNLTILWDVHSPAFRDLNGVSTKETRPYRTVPSAIIGQYGNTKFALLYSDVYSKFKSSTITGHGISLTFGTFSLAQNETLNIGEFEVSIQRVPSTSMVPMRRTEYYYPSPDTYPIKRYFDIYDHDGNVIGRTVVTIYGSRKRGSNYAYLEDGVEGVTSVGYAVAPKYGKFHSLYTKFEFCGGYFGSGYPNVPIKLNYDAIGGDRTSIQFTEVHKTLIDLVSNYIEGGGFVGILLNGLSAESKNDRGTNVLTKYYRGPISISSRGVILYYLGADEIGQYYTYTVHLPYELDEDMVKFCLTVKPGIAVPHPSFPTDRLYTREYSIPIWISLQRP